MLGLTIGQTSTSTGLGRAAAVTASATDVVFVHGAGCGAIAYTTTAIRDLEAAGRAASTLHTVSYYACDVGGVSIMNEGSSSYLPSRDANDTSTDVRRFSYELAWYLWNTFGAKGKPVDVVGHSMGGIIITYALQRIAAHDPDYPTSLTVRSVTTFSAPYAGVSQSLCAQDTTTECTQLLAGSSLINQITATGAVTLGSKTVWTAVASEGADAIPSKSTLALAKVTYRVDYTYPAYTHTSYLVDASALRNARGTLNGTPFATGAHSLALLAQLLT